jgi:hypothetical protein
MTPRFHPGLNPECPRSCFVVIQDAGMPPIRFDLRQEAIAELVSAAMAFVAILAGIAVTSLPSLATEFNAGQPAAVRPENFGAVLCWLLLRKPSARLRLAPVIARNLAEVAATLKNWVPLADSVSQLIPVSSPRSRNAAAPPEYSSVNPARRPLSARQSTSELE